MRDGLRTLTELVDRIEGGGIVVDDAAISRADDDEIAVDLSVRFPADGGAVVGDGGHTVDDQLYRGGTAGAAGESQDVPTATKPSDGTAPEGVPTGCGGAVPDAGAVPPNFGETAARVGGPVVGSIADALDTAERSAVDGDGPNGGENASTGRADEPSRGRNGEPPESGSDSSSDDELVTCRVDGCDERFETDHGMKIHATKAHQSDDGSAPSPHRNPERLREVYEACDTFEEMTAALDVDVTSQTVRRSMMRLGVHDPSADDGRSSGAEGVAPPHLAPTDAPTGGTGDADDESPTEARAEGADADAPRGADESDSAPFADESGAAETAPDARADGTDPDAEESGSGAEDPETEDGGPESAPGDQGADDRGAGDRAANDSEAEADGEAEVDDRADGSDVGPDDPDDPNAADPAVLAEVDDVLPPEVDGAAFVDAVRAASTLYEVQRRLDMDRDAVQTLLAELDLLDLVHGRVATRGEREEQKAEIERRILARGRDGADEVRDERSDEAADGAPGESADGASEERADDRTSDGPGEHARAD